MASLWKRTFVAALLAVGAIEAGLVGPASADDLLGLTKLTLGLYGLSANTLTLLKSHEALH